VSDPAFGTKHFLLYGNRGNNGILVSLDFSGIHEKECVGFDTPGTATSDYEYWRPSDRDNDECLLGRTIQYVRRKQNAKCFNPLSWTRKDATAIKNCSCTDENYECDYCFVRDSTGRNCIPDKIDSKCAAYDPKKPPTPCTSIWFETQGYRRVPGDTCNISVGLNWDPIARVCPGAPGPNPSGPPSTSGTPSNPGTPTEQPSSSRGVIAALAIALVLTIGVGVLWYLAGHNATVRSYIERVIPERFLPDLAAGSTAQGEYAPVSLVEDDIEDDAREVTNLSDDTSDAIGLPKP